MAWAAEDNKGVRVIVDELLALVGASHCRAAEDAIDSQGTLRWGACPARQPGA